MEMNNISTDAKSGFSGNQLLTSQKGSWHSPNCTMMLLRSSPRVTVK
jgi:hypothetical protein